MTRTRIIIEVIAWSPVIAFALYGFIAVLPQF